MITTNFLICFTLTSVVLGFLIVRELNHFVTKHYEKREQLLVLTALKSGVISKKQYETLNYLVSLSTPALKQAELHADKIFKISIEKSNATYEAVKAELDKLETKYLKDRKKA